MADAKDEVLKRVLQMKMRALGDPAQVLMLRAWRRPVLSPRLAAPMSVFCRTSTTPRNFASKSNMRPMRP